MTLEERYADGPQLLAFHKEKLLIPGWAGELDSVELEYIISQLKQFPSLKRRWGFRPTAKRISRARVCFIAMHGFQPRQGLRFSFSQKDENSKKYSKVLPTSSVTWQ
jgi:hypothetical protein